MTTLYLVRHGESTWNEVGRIQGKQDPPLSDLGRRQARALAGGLRHEQLDAIYSSSQQRARSTAEIVAGVHGLPVTIVEDLTEIDHGHWEGLTQLEVEQQFAASFQTWLQRPSQTQMPGGEHCLSLQQRVLDAWQHILVEEKGHHVLIVSHDIPIKVMIADVLGLELDRIGQFAVANAAISVVQAIDGRLQLRHLNQTCHLDSITAGR